MFDFFTNKPLLIITLTSMSLLSFVQTGCSPTVKVEGPEKPITINLNVKVEQDIKLKADEQLDQLIKQNPDIF